MRQIVPGSLHDVASGFFSFNIYCKISCFSFLNPQCSLVSLVPLLLERGLHVRINYQTVLSKFLCMFKDIIHFLELLRNSVVRKTYHHALSVANNVITKEK